MYKKVWETLYIFLIYLKMLFAKWIPILFTIPEILDLLKNLFPPIPVHLPETWDSLLAIIGLVWANFLVFLDLLNNHNENKDAFIFQPIIKCRIEPGDYYHFSPVPIEKSFGYISAGSKIHDMNLDIKFEIINDGKIDVDISLEDGLDFGHFNFPWQILIENFSPMSSEGLSVKQRKLQARIRVILQPKSLDLSTFREACKRLNPNMRVKSIATIKFIGKNGRKGNYKYILKIPITELIDGYNNILQKNTLD